MSMNHLAVFLEKEREPPPPNPFLEMVKEFEAAHSRFHEVHGEMAVLVPLYRDRYPKWKAAQVLQAAYDAGCAIHDTPT